MTRNALLLVVALSLSAVWARPASAVTVFSEGMVTPETISAIPAGFAANGGGYLIPDAQGGIVWSVPVAGGPPSVFAQVVGERTLGGLFLPDSGWGAFGGRYITVGSDPTNLNYGRIHAYAADGTSTLVAELPTGGAYLSVPRIAPAGFGDYAGRLMISAQSQGIYAFDLDHGFVPFVLPPKLGYFGTAFAPAGFGAVGGKLLAEVVSGEIYAIDPDGSTSLFTAVPLYEGQGTRQMEFAPAGFLSSLGIEQAVLLISVAGSSDASGPLGDVLAIDDRGDVVASLRVADDLLKFNPRGLLIVGDELRSSDASDPIISADVSEFQPGRDANIPEPSAGMLLMGAAAAVARRR